ncbi:hypothetical protein [Brachybacterium tyrofermentans]|uniref:hypothetical protein n=1 Tax=Brachybacterium tyrofermentans TaxID=47848 RepID=UPI003FD04B04
MPETSALGSRIRRYRPSIHLSHALPYLGCFPATLALMSLASVLVGDGAEVGTLLLVAVLYLVLTGLVCAVQWSAYLDLHEKGLVVGRSVLGRRRPMRYTEIDPTTLRVFSGIDAVRGGLRAPIWANWHFTGGADLAVTFLGPRRGRRLPPAPRPPAPGSGIVLFGSRDAALIAGQIRAGLERAGCPPHLARWSEQFGIEAVTGASFEAQEKIPGMSADWTRGSDLP